MHTHLYALFGFASLFALSPGQADDRPQQNPWTSFAPVYRQLKRQMARASGHVQSANAELEYCKQYFPCVATRHTVQTVTGQSAEVIFLDARPPIFPEKDLTMAFLQIRDHLIDWVSCWTDKRIGLQQMLLEDVDGDGHLDLAFRYMKDKWGPLDDRKNTRPGDDRTWLYAYKITDSGFQSLFPLIERDLPVQIVHDPSDNQPVRVEIAGVPPVVRENKMIAFSVRATNISKGAIPIEGGPWFRLDGWEKHPYTVIVWSDYRSGRKLLKPGQTVSCRLLLVPTLDHRSEAADRVILRWSFVPQHLPDGPS